MTVYSFHDVPMDEWVVCASCGSDRATFHEYPNGERDFTCPDCGALTQ